MCNISAVKDTNRFKLATELFGPAHKTDRNKDGHAFGLWFVEAEDKTTFDQMEKEQG